MAQGIMMPKQGITVETCILSKWHKSVGDKISVGDVVFSYETDKASFDYEAEVAGEVLALFYGEGDEVPVLVNVLAVGNKGEDYSGLNANGSEQAKAPEAPAAAPTAAKAAAPKGGDGPIAQGVMMPKQGITVETCILSKWHKNVGDKVSVGELLFSYETDKASFDFESEVAGEVLAQFYADGDEVPVLVNVCAVGNKGDSFEGLGNVEEEAEIAPEIKVEKAAAPTIQADGPTAVFSAVKFASPRAKNLATKLGVSVSDIHGRGPKGRVIEMDVREYAASGKAQAISAPKAESAPSMKATENAFEDVKLPNIRKVIAKQMTLSLQSMAQLTHTVGFDATNILAFRADLKKNQEKLNLPNITLNDIIIYAVTRVLKYDRHKHLNAHLLGGDTMRYFSSVNMGMAVDTPRGLLVPTIFDADKKSLSEISREAKAVAKAAQSGSIDPSLLSGGTFTISNLGSFGVEHFTPVINPPQTGILGVNTIETRVRVVDGNVVPYKAMTLSLTYDHRALDGAPASQFLKDVGEYLESFTMNLMSEVI